MSQRVREYKVDVVQPFSGIASIYLIKWLRSQCAFFNKSTIAFTFFKFFLPSLIERANQKWKNKGKKSKRIFSYSKSIRKSSNMNKYLAWLICLCFDERSVVLWKKMVVFRIEIKYLLFDLVHRWWIIDYLHKSDCKLKPQTFERKIDFIFLPGVCPQNWQGFCVGKASRDHLLLSISIYFQRTF